MSRYPAAYVGSEVPRIFTPPLRRLTPKTTRGYEVIAFVEAMSAAGVTDQRGEPIRLLPWQRWLFLHALELNRDGTYRFSEVLVLVARQNGKTFALQVLALWWMATRSHAGMVFGTSTNSEYARESWSKTVELAQARDRVLYGDEQHEDRWLNPVEKWSVKRGALDTRMTLQTNRASYKIGTASRTGGRSLTIGLGIVDELREHRPKGESTGFEAWAAVSGTTTAVPDAQLWALSNAGEADSVVLNFQLEQAHAEIEAGLTAESTSFLAEWSVDAEADPYDEKLWKWANPSLGHTITIQTLRAKAKKLPVAIWKTEHLCIGVERLDGAIPVGPWKACGDQTIDLAKLRRVTALCVEVSEDLEHVTLVAAAEDKTGTVLLDVVAAWDSVQQAADELEAEVRKVRPREVGWFPSGPGAALAPAMKRVARRAKVVDLGEAEQKAACQGLFTRVKPGRVRHPNDPLLNAHMISAGRQQVGDGWRFRRRGAGRIDAAFAAAGATYLAAVMLKPGRPQSSRSSQASDPAA